MREREREEQAKKRQAFTKVNIERELKKKKDIESTIVRKELSVKAV